MALSLTTRRVQGRKIMLSNGEENLLLQAYRSYYDEFILALLMVAPSRVAPSLRELMLALPDDSAERREIASALQTSWGDSPAS